MHKLRIGKKVWKPLRVDIWVPGTIVRREGSDLYQALACLCMCVALQITQFVFALIGMAMSLNEPGRLNDGQVSGLFDM